MKHNGNKISYDVYYRYKLSEIEYINIMQILKFKQRG